MPEMALPVCRISGTDQVTVSGSWRVGSLASGKTFAAVASSVRQAAGKKDALWDLSGVSEMDYIGARFLWDAWGQKRPARLRLLPEHEALFGRLEKAGPLKRGQTGKKVFLPGAFIRAAAGALGSHFMDMVTLAGQFVLDLARLFCHPLAGPWKEISANVYHAGTRAIGITALVGFLIGVVLSYLSAQQLHDFGGDPYLVNLLGIGITRELGPLLAAILVAGRSGSAMTAQIGVMRVTEELDAMQVMGMSQGFRLVLPKVAALVIVMPLLIMWTNIVALVGGMLAAQLSIGLSTDYFITALPGAVPQANLFIGLGKGVVFGMLIGLVACHFGLRIRPDTESLGQGTTSAVVSAITIVILADAVFAMALQHVGWS
ncbi:MAG: ABC transporter permease [Alistipes senegalensis]|nr:ABC transporter permease [Oxalobacter formigenes]MCM1280405.1 ABC transporter permease [Alistipes senegalensis]